MGAEPKPLSGRVAIVTGGSRGIGAAIVRRLAGDGASVAFTYQSSSDAARALADELSTPEAPVVAIACDQADRAAVVAMVRSVHGRFGRLDILVNNAGVMILGPIDDPDRDQDEMDRQVMVNMLSAVAAVREAAGLMGEGGRIISLGSVSTQRSPFPGLGDYTATKAAMAAYTRSWARDLGPRGITANIIHPGAIDTEMNSAAGPFAHVLRDLTPLGRYARTEELANVVAFLAGPQSSYVNGAELLVDGGQAA